MTSRNYNVGNEPPRVTWTVVRGDTASFKVYVTDDARIPLEIPSWDIEMEFKRNGTIITTTTPEQDADDLEGEFTVSLTSSQTRILETNDIFDIQLSAPGTVWTVAQGKMFIIDDVTDVP
jgi:hypothetical protein